MGKPYFIIENHLKKGDVIIEIGGERGEGSTTYLADMAIRKGLEFHSVDIDTELSEKLKINGVIPHIMDGATFLKDFDKKIKFAYLDNYDWIFTNDPNVEFIKNRYRRFETEHSNIDSMTTHLIQAILVDRKKAEECFILFDDTWKIDKKYDGKGGLAVPFLLSLGYQIINDAKEGEDKSSYVLLKK